MEETNPEEKSYDLIFNFQSKDNKMRILLDIIKLSENLNKYGISIKAVRHIEERSTEDIVLSAKLIPDNCAVIRDVKSSNELKDFENPITLLNKAFIILSSMDPLNSETDDDKINVQSNIE